MMNTCIFLRSNESFIDYCRKISENAKNGRLLDDGFMEDNESFSSEAELKSKAIADEVDSLLALFDD